MTERPLRPATVTRDVLERTAWRLAERLAQLESTLETDPSAWPEYIGTASALAAVLGQAAPGRAGELLTTAEMAALVDLETAGMIVTTRRVGATSRHLLLPVEKWKVPLTGRRQRPVDQSPPATGSPATCRSDSPNLSVAEPEPVGQGDTLGSAAGSGAVAVAWEQSPTTATEARQAVEAMLQRLNTKLGPAT